MSPSFALPDTASLNDLRTYLGRAARVEDGSVRLIAGAGVLAVYTAVLYPAGLLDEVPTVLGLRTFELTEAVSFDAVVPIESFAERLRIVAERLDDSAGDDSAGDDSVGDDIDGHGDDGDDGDDEDAHTADDDLPEDPATPAHGIVIELPLQVNTVTWAAISPPRGGWVPLPDLDVTVLRDQARVGIAEVAETVPTASGDAVVRRVRSEVWGRPIAQSEHVPAGAAFAAESLGFLRDGDRVRLFETGPWSRLTTTRGHVLVKRRAWSLSR
ncbi:hypothetical protein [Curtobacterium sp. Leaf261]|uniref:hypothetical protein n=1 Tax=Curtobacterium sp. Leaf261 TaxID=1736311 RepID=UPI0006F47285|nr:hypothetical protein [Curtobacterium sp. Leaf261]KQO62986.1 hypothetical protein ASF23_08840 [Curtobacterium sp. Leaf261]